ncbi:MAG: DUF4142 domain-containing protein [Pseudomonas sp.]
MNKYTTLSSALVLALGLSAPAAFAESASQQPPGSAQNTREATATAPSASPAEHQRRSESIDAEDFVEEASAKGIAEIETGKMALERGTETVHRFAQKMIDDHTNANEKLKELASKHDLDISDDPTLMDRAKAMTLRVRDGESFDQAYAKNQVNAHEESIELFQRASNSDLADISNFANETLPKLEEHLKMARELARKTEAADN